MKSSFFFFFFFLQHLVLFKGCLLSIIRVLSYLMWMPIWVSFQYGYKLSNSTWSRKNAMWVGLVADGVQPGRNVEIVVFLVYRLY